MENNEIYLEQLQLLVGSGIDDNIKLALQIAEGLELTEKVIQPWRYLWEKSHFGNKKNTENDIYIIQRLTTTSYLHLSNCNLTKLPYIVTFMKNLSELNLAGNSFTEIPDGLVNLRKLKVLNLNNNKIKTLPDFLFSMDSLDCLGLGGNLLKNITSLPEKLTILNISDNKFIKTPDFLFKKNNLKGLDITKNSGFVWDLSELDMERIEYLTFGDSVISKLKNHNYNRVSWWYDEKGKLVRLFGTTEKYSYRFSSGIEECLDFPDHEFPDYHCWWYYDGDEDSYEFSDYLEDFANKTKERFRYRA